MSIFLLTNFGITYNSIKRLYEFGIKNIQQIEKEPECLNIIFGKTSVKATQILNAIYKIHVLENENDVWRLFSCGLKLYIIRKLRDYRISLENLEKYIILNKLKKEGCFTDFEEKCIIGAYDILINGIQNIEILKKYQLSNHHIDTLKKLNITFDILKNENANILLKEKYYLTDSTIIKIINSYKLFCEDMKKNKSYLISNVDQNVKRLNIILSNNDLNMLLNFDFNEAKIQELNQIKFSLIDLLDKEYIDILKNKYQLNEATILKFDIVRLYMISLFFNTTNTTYLSSKELKSIYKILKLMKKEYITIDELNKYLLEEYKYTYSSDELINALNSLQNEGKIQFENEKILVKYITLEEKIKEKLNEKYKVIFIERIKGKTLEEIGSQTSYTRSRIGQIIKESLKTLGFVREDTYYKLFKEYEWSKEIFCNIFNEPSETFNYLNLKYEKGKKDLFELFNSQELTEEQKEILKKYLNLITYENIVMPCKEKYLIENILKVSSQSHTIEEIFEIYNNTLLENNCFENKLNLLNDNDKNRVESYLDNSEKLISSFKRKYRYYNYEIITKEILLQLENLLLELKDGDYSIDILFDNNIELMNNINIIDKYELHYLLRKYINNTKIIFKRMPNFTIKQ